MSEQNIMDFKKKDRFSKDYPNLLVGYKLSSMLEMAPKAEPSKPERREIFTYKRFRSFKFFPPGTRLNEALRDLQLVFLDSDYECSGRKPQNLSKKEWLAVNIYLMYNHACEIYGWVQNFCNQASCPIMSAGEKYEFKWADGKLIETPISIPAVDYTSHLFTWIEYQLNDRSIFPNYNSAHYSQSIFTPVIRDIFRRLLRVYAHVLHHHLKNLEDVGFKKNFADGLKYFVHFSNHYDLVDHKSLGPIFSSREWDRISGSKLQNLNV